MVVPGYRRPGNGLRHPDRFSGNASGWAGPRCHRRRCRCLDRLAASRVFPPCAPELPASVTVMPWVPATGAQVTCPSRTFRPSWRCGSPRNPCFQPLCKSAAMNLRSALPSVKAEVEATAQACSARIIGTAALGIQLKGGQRALATTAVPRRSSATSARLSTARWSSTSPTRLPTSRARHPADVLALFLIPGLAVLLVLARASVGG
jgi:hypothetical protein